MEPPLNLPPRSDRFLAWYARKGWPGFDWLRAASGRSAGGRLRAASRYGSEFELGLGDYIDRIVLREGYYESEVLEAVTAALADGGVLWDIGANFGLHGITAGKLVPAARVICFEPSPVEVARLLRNREINRLDVGIVSAALSDSGGFRTLHLGPEGNPGMASLTPWDGMNSSGTCLVATARGDDLVAQGLLPAPTVIKLDVEGHEREVLQGLPRILRSPDLTTVVFEDGPAAATPAKEILGAAGFACTRLARREAPSQNLENFAAVRRRRTAA